MPSSTLLLILIGFLSVCALCVHVVIHHHISRGSGRRRSKTLVQPINDLSVDWIKPSHGRDLTSASA